MIVRSLEWRYGQTNHMNLPCKTRSFRSLITMPTNPCDDLSLRRVFRPLEGSRADKDIIKDGLDTSKQVFCVLKDFAGRKNTLDGQNKLADCHLLPMIGYFQQSDEGRIRLADFPHLSKWWSIVSSLKMMTATRPIFEKTTQASCVCWWHLLFKRPLTTVCPTSHKEFKNGLVNRDTGGSRTHQRACG